MSITRSSIAGSSRVLGKYGLPSTVRKNDSLEFFNAIRDNDHETLKTLLEKSPSLVFETSFGQATPLHKAAESGNTQLAELFLAHNAAVDATNAENYTPLHLAADKNHSEIVALLLAHGAQVDARGKDNITPLYLAAWHSHTAIAEQLLTHGAQIDHQALSNWTALHAAAQAEYIDMVRVLLAHGANPNIQSKYDGTPFTIALKSGSQQLQELLAASGANLEAEKAAFQSAQQRKSLKLQAERKNALAKICFGALLLLGGPLLGFVIAPGIGSSPFSHAFTSAPEWMPSPLQNPLAVGVGASVCACIYAGIKMLWGGIKELNDLP